MSRQRTINLEVVCWMQQMQGLYDYRTDQRDERRQFKSFRFSFPKPRPNSSVYYIIHQELTNSRITAFKFERRKILESFWNISQPIQMYTIIGAFQITHTQDSIQSPISIKIIDPQEIVVRSSGNKTQAKSNVLPYWVVRTISEYENWEVREKQVIKFGRLKLLVYEEKIKLNKEKENFQKQGILDLDELIEDSKMESKIAKIKEQGENKCRICYEGEKVEEGEREREAAEDGLLINPCKCKGSMAYVHVGCLKQWLDSRLTKISLQNNGRIKITDKDCCEICKMKFPLRIKKGGQVIPLISFMEENPYISFVYVGEEEIDPSQKFYVSFGEDKLIQIGRVEDSGLFLADQTVSRNHAQLQLQKDKCILKDLQSKYGTLVYDKYFQAKLGRFAQAFQISNMVFCFTYSH